MKIEAAQRLMAYDNRWSEKVERKQDLKHGNSPEPVQNTDQAMFSMQPTALAQALKRMYGDDYRAASSALSFYINRSGKKLLSPDKDRLSKARDALRKAYGKDNDTGPQMPKSDINEGPVMPKSDIGKEPPMPKPMNAPSMPKPIGR